MAAALRYPDGMERDLLLDRSSWMQRAFAMMDRDTLVNWWDYYPFGKTLSLLGAKNTMITECINGTSTCIDAIKREEHALF